MSGQHTQGRLVVRDTWLIPEEHANRPIGGSTDKAKDRDYYASIVTTVNGKYHDNHANARRFAACWNACHGIGTERLEASAMHGAKQADDLGAARHLLHEVTNFGDDLPFLLVEKIHKFLKGGAA